MQRQEGDATTYTDWLKAFKVNREMEPRKRHGPLPADTPDYIVFGMLLLVQSVLRYWLILCRDFFTYQYYPIRFYRRTRTVYAYADGGLDAVICVPWEGAQFHVGKGKGEGERYLRDIRCHVLDGGATWTKARHPCRCRWWPAAGCC